MKTRHILLASAGTVAALLLAANLAAADDRHGQRSGSQNDMRMTNAERGHHVMGDGMHGSGRRGGAAMFRMLERYDIDGDGELTAEEVTEARNAQLAEFDADGDGMLDLEEYQVLWLDAMHERMVDRFQHHDADGDGAVTQDEFARDLARMIEMRDRHGGGMRGGKGREQDAE